jgi:HSP20 family protein
MLPFGAWSFPDIDEMMKEMEKEFSQFKDLENQVPKTLVRETKDRDGMIRKEIGPIVYGYSMTIGPDGKPVVREFGNVKRRTDAPLKDITDEREPLIDVVDSEGTIKVIAELPGVKKDDIALSVDGTKLTISVSTADRKYHKELQLPSPVKLESARSTYNNGILEITFEKESQTGKSVRLRID